MDPIPSQVAGRPRRVGRPRLQPSADLLDPREEILQAAAALFAEHGYAATTTRAIADRVGVRQASLFHHFEKKESIFFELLDRTVRPGLAFSTWLDRAAVDAAVGLHALCWLDSHTLCSNPNNLAALQLLHEARDERFAGFWSARTELQMGYARRVVGVLDRGDLPEPSAALAVELIFGLVESVITWFDRDTSRQPVEVANAVADGALRLVGVESVLLAEIAVASAELRSAYVEAVSQPMGLD